MTLTYEDHLRIQFLMRERRFDYLQARNTVQCEQQLKQINEQQQRRRVTEALAGRQAPEQRNAQ